MSRTVHGIIRGNTIELAEALGIAEGQEVEVRVTVVVPRSKQGDGLRRCAGALADEWTDEDDRIWEEIRQSRQVDRRREIAE